MNVLTNAGSVLGLVALLVAALAVAYSALIRTTVATLKGSNEAYEQRIKILEDGRAEDKADLKRLATENAVLRGVVTGEEQLAAIRRSMAERHEQTVTWWTATTASLEAIQAALEGNP